MKKRILLIEDEQEIAFILRMRLEAFGYEVFQAHDGEEGLKSAKKLIPDLILLDLVLPKIGGIEVLENLKSDAKYNKIPVVVVTGLATDGFNLKNSLAKADAYFLKPFDSVELMAAIEDLLKSPRS